MDESDWFDVPRRCKLALDFKGQRAQGHRWNDPVTDSDVVDGHTHEGNGCVAGQQREHTEIFKYSASKAYQLDGIQEVSYPALDDLTPAVLARNQDTIQNIRLWDSQPLLQTYEHTQAIRLYYEFYNVGVDRYHLSDGYHQVMLATRELAPELPLQAQTWVNEPLQFTHGCPISWTASKVWRPLASWLSRRLA
jgi:hypothetical protein